MPDESARVAVYRYVNAQPAEWPKADFIIGNPPYIGNFRMRDVLGEGYTEALRNTYPDVPESSDYVMYWWHKAAELTRLGEVRRFGLITTNSFSQAFGRRVAELHLAAEPPLSIVFAIPDHPWVDTTDGAAVRVAMTVGEKGRHEGTLARVTSEVVGESEEVDVSLTLRDGHINPNLTIGPNVASAGSLRANDRISSPGFKLHGDGFVVSENDRASLNAAIGAGIVRPYRNGKDLTQHSRNSYVIDLFGWDLNRVRDEFPEVYQWIAGKVRPEREARRGRTPDATAYADQWWQFGKPRPELRKSLAGLKRFIATPETAKHRFFVFLNADIAPDNMLICFALDDAFYLGVLSSRVHVNWVLAAGGTLEDRPRYNKTVCFDPFPFPATDEATKARIRQLAERLDRHRSRQQQLHPKLTMTGMYNVLEKLRRDESLTAKERVVYEEGAVSVLKEIHDEIDAEILAAYGWPLSLTDDQILERLLALNAERAAEEGEGLVRWLRPELQARSAVAATQRPLVSPEVPATKPAREESPEWPTTLPEQLTILRMVMYSFVERWTTKSLMKEFRGPKRKEVEAALESLEALGLVVSVGEGDNRMWTALRPVPHQRRIVPLSI